MSRSVRGVRQSQVTSDRRSYVVQDPVLDLEGGHNSYHRAVGARNINQIERPRPNVVAWEGVTLVRLDEG